MGKKQDIQQLESVCREFHLSATDRRDFSDFLETEKESGNGGTKNERGDFTYQELRVKLQEFLGIEAIE